MTPRELDLKGLREAAVKGSALPWQIENDYVPGCLTIIANVDGEIIDGRTHHTFDFIAQCVDDCGEFSADAVGNAALIVSAINALPHLLDEIEQLRAEREQDRCVIDLLKQDVASASDPAWRQRFDAAISEIERNSTWGWLQRYEAAEAIITRLRADLDAAREALEPFANEAGEWLTVSPDTTPVLTMGPADSEASLSGFTLGDLRRAATVHDRLGVGK